MTDRAASMTARTAFRRPAERTTLLACVTAAAALVYLNALGNGFALDDVAIIQENARVHDLTNLRAIWLTPYWPFYGIELGLWRPFAIFAYAVQWAVGGGSPVVFHAVSILMHAGVTALVFLLLARLTAAVPAFWGALVFAVHPVHTEAVANVVGQAELIVAAALVAACLVHATRPPGHALSWRRRSALCALFAVAVLTKENAVVLPGLLVAVDFAQRRVRLTPAGAAAYLGALLVPMLLLGAVLLAWLVVRIDVLEGALVGVQAGPQLHYLREEYRVLNALRAFPELLRLLVFPAALAVDYSPAMILPADSFTPMVLVGALLLAATAALAVLTPWNPAAGFAAAWFLIGIITVSNIFFPIGVLVAERTLYLPSVAVSAAIAFAIAAGRPRASAGARRAAVALLLAVVVAGGVRTWLRNPDWRSTQQILYALLRDHPESYKAQWTHASWQWQLGRPERARHHYELALRIYPRDSQLMTDYADFLLQHGDAGRALSLLEQSYETHPFVPRTVVLLGSAYAGAAQYDDALRVAREAQQAGMDVAVTMPILAAAYDGLGRSDRALATWRFVIRHAALQPHEWAHLARNLARRGALPDAAAAVQRGLAAAADPATLQLLRDVQTAVETGCYADDRTAAPTEDRTGASADPAGAPAGDRTAAPAPTPEAARPACDPLAPGRPVSR